MIYFKHGWHSYKMGQHPAFAVRPGMWGSAIRTDPNLLRALLRGCQEELARVDQAILEVRRKIGEGHSLKVKATLDGRQLSGTALLSTDAIKRIASARKRGRTEYKKRKASRP